MILVSACLMGENSKYHGGNNDCPKVHEFLEGKEYLPFCPETMGGLAVPREPVEIITDGKAINKIGEDVSAAFARGAAASLALATDNQVDLAILKDGSPSCGVHYIYDGTFTHKTIPGRGKTAGLLIENGIKVVSEEDL